MSAVSKMNLAKPIFLRGKNLEKNCQAGFRHDISLSEKPRSLQLFITAATFYRVYFNAQFLVHGPARAAHRMARVDEIDLADTSVVGRNSLAIEVAGYNEENIYVTGDSSFLMAEVHLDGSPHAATDESWIALYLSQRRQIVERFSHARCANELYDLDAGYFNWRIKPLNEIESHSVERVAGPTKLFPRGMDFPDLSFVTPPRLLATADIYQNPSKEVPEFTWYETADYGKWLNSGAVERPAVEDHKTVDCAFTGKLISGNVDLIVDSLQHPAALDYDFGTLASGFLGVQFTCTEPITLDLVHGDRLDARGWLDPRNCGSNCVVRLHAKPGRYRFESFEPYCVRYVRLIIRGKGTITLHELFLRSYQFLDIPAGSFACDDGSLNRIYESARLTLRANMLDVFMDCPGRERAGWLCDSLWAGRAARMMLNDSGVERAMLENFLHAAPGDTRKGFFQAVILPFVSSMIRLFPIGRCFWFGS